jgi:hypothetical protein
VRVWPQHERLRKQRGSELTMARGKVTVGKKQTVRQGNAAVPGYSAPVASGQSVGGTAKPVTTTPQAVASGANISKQGVPIIGANTANAPSVTQARGTRTRPVQGTPPNIGQRTRPNAGATPNTGTTTPPKQGTGPNVGTRTRPITKTQPNVGTRTRPK